MRDRKGWENELVDHLNILELPNSLVEKEEFSDNIFEKAVMQLAVVATHWYANISNYFVSEIIPDFSNP